MLKLLKISKIKYFAELNTFKDKKYYYDIEIFNIKTYYEFHKIEDSIILLILLIHKIVQVVSNKRCLSTYIRTQNTQTDTVDKLFVLLFF